MTQQAEVSQETLERARRWCRIHAERHYENFAVASRIIPRGRRDEYFALYAFARGADDLADRTGRQPDAKERLADLDRWEAWLHDLYNGKRPAHPAFIALLPVIREYRLEKEWFLRLLNAFRQDQTQIRYDTWEDVREYAAGSANPVGRLVLRLYGYRNPELDTLADCICTALQLVNFIQDIREDYLLRDRVYFPREDMQRFGVREENLAQIPAGERLRRLVEFESHRAERLLHEGRPLLSRVCTELSRQLILFHGGGRLALQAIRRANFDVASERRIVRRHEKIALLIRAMAKKPL